MKREKFAALLLAAAVCLTVLTACGKGEPPAGGTTGPVSESTPLATSASMPASASTPAPADTGTAAPLTPEQDAAAIQRVIDKLNTGVYDIRTGEKTDDEIAWFRFEMNDGASGLDAVYCFVKVPWRNVNGVPEGESGIWFYHVPTDTLVKLDWREALKDQNVGLLACKMTDSYNLYALCAKGSDGYLSRLCFPVLAHFRLTPRLAGGEFTCEIACETEAYYAPVSEDLYVAGFGVNIGGMETFARESLIGVAETFDGISLLVDLSPEYRMLSRDESAPWLNADFCYDESARTLTVTMECTPCGDMRFGDLGIQNVYVESAELREYKTHGAQLALHLTEYARYYTVVEDEVFAPDCPPSGIMQSGESVYAQCYYRNLKILFSVGEYEKSEERMTHAEGFPYHVYADPITWQSAWESVDAVWTPMDLREALVPYVRAVQESGYMPSQTLDDWPKRPSAQF